jgi:hypothetical protein
MHKYDRVLVTKSICLERSSKKPRFKDLLLISSPCTWSSCGDSFIYQNVCVHVLSVFTNNCMNWQSETNVIIFLCLFLCYLLCFVINIAVVYFSDRYFVSTNATSTFHSIVSSYPGRLTLVTIQVSFYSYGSYAFFKETGGVVPLLIIIH